MTMRFAFFKGCTIPIRFPHLELVARKVLPEFGIELVDLDGFTCCPEPVEFAHVNRLAALAISARNLAIAEASGLNIITLCNGCAMSLTNANQVLGKDEKLRERINELLGPFGFQFKGTSAVRHFLSVFAKDIGMERIRAAVKNPLTGMRIATHTGCHLLSPPEMMGFDSNPEDPTVFDSLVEALGATAVDYDMKPMCCGVAFTQSAQLDASYRLLAEKLRSAHDAGATHFAVGCPACFQQLDSGQVIAAKKFNLDFKLPVLYYTQLAGLALGHSPDEMQFPAHRTR